MNLKNFFKISTFTFFIMIIFSHYSYANEGCFVAKENGIIIKKIGNCNKRHSPFSTFKIPLAIIGFESGILTSIYNPKINFTNDIEKNYVTYYNPQKFPIMLLWKRAQTPQSWMRDSVVWYSRYITHTLQAEKFQEYVKKLNFGNSDVSGNQNFKDSLSFQNDGLMSSWLNSSLQISPLEQVNFNEKLANKSLPVSQNAQNNTINLIKLENIFDDWQVYGKTGGSMDLGWFVGWIEKNKRKIIFAQYLEQSETSLISAGRMAKEVAKDNLISLIQK